MGGSSLFPAYRQRDQRPCADPTDKGIEVGPTAQIQIDARRPPSDREKVGVGNREAVVDEILAASQVRVDMV